ncbi:MAG: HAMP domain-containing histidine kinase, partial [Oscillospiraceae bacterium]|nr:HAMP domain-containing histidine kinase [Oscillospiraceae bacterium]
MDIKLKRYNIWLKVVAFILAAVALAGAFVAVIAFDTRDDQSYGWYPVREAFFARHFTDTSMYRNDFNVVLNNMNNIVYLTERIARGDYSNDEYYYYSSNGYIGNEYRGREALEKNIEADFDYLNSREPPYYCMELDGEIYTNLPGMTPEELRNWTYSESWNANLVAAYSEEYVERMNLDFLKSKTATIDMFRLLALLAAAFIICAAYLIFAAGRSTADKKIKLLTVDRLYTEFTLVLSIGVVALAAGLASEFIYSWPSYNYYGAGHSALWLPVYTALAALLGMFLMSLVRRLKDKTILTHSLVWAILGRVFRFLKAVYLSNSLTRRVVVAVIGLGTLTWVSGVLFTVMFTGYGIYGFATIFPIIGLLSVPLSVYLAFRALKRLTSVQEEVLNAEMNKRFRAERMRTELISNVSHDLRTPLTSVITYIDLLKKEELESETARGYIEVIDSKAQRLKVLTDDLFEASKAASGNIPVALEAVYLEELVTQGLGEMDEKIRASGLDFRVSLSRDMDPVSADGKLLWRVVENLLSNVFKYAMP